MAILNQTMLAKLVREGAGHYALIKGAKYTVTKGCLFCGRKINIINFCNGKKYVVDQAERNSCYINVGEYLLSIRRNNGLLDFTDVVTYDISSGVSSESQNIKEETCDFGNILVLDKKILVIRKGNTPRFFAVIGKKLEELSAVMAECALLQTTYTEKQLESFIRFYSESNWEVHNGLVFNPLTKEVPAALHFKLWLNARKTVKAKMRQPVNTDMLARILTGSERNVHGIRLIDTQQL